MKITRTLLKTITTSTTSWSVKLTSSLLFAGIFFTACKDPKKVSLEKQVLQDPVGIFFTDTFKIHVETVRFEAPSTKNSPHLLIGRFKDPLVGTITCSSYSQLSFADFDTLRLTDKSEIDSVVLQFAPSFVHGDSSKNLKFGVHLLNQVIDSAKASNYTHESVIGFDKSAVANFSLTGFSNSTPFRANSEILKTKFRTLLRAKGYGQNEFNTKLNGLAFVPDTSSSDFAIGIIAQNSMFSTIVYYTDSTNGTKTRGTYTFNVSINSQRFTHASVTDYVNVASLFNGTSVLPSQQIQNLGIMNDLLGIRTRITIPGLSDFLNKIKTDYNLLEVAVRFPNAGFYRQTVNRPYGFLNFAETSANGLPLKTSSGVYSLLQNEVINSYNKGNVYGTGNDSYVAYNNQNGYFDFPLTLYAKEIMNGGKQSFPFIVSIASFYGLGSQAPLSYAFFNQSLPNKGIKLQVYYGKKN